MRFGSLLLAILIGVAQTARWTDCLCGMTCPKPGECPSCPGERAVTPKPAPEKKSCCKHQQPAPSEEKHAKHTPSKNCQHIQPQRDVLPPADAAALAPLAPCPVFLTGLLPDPGVRPVPVVATESPPDTGPPLFLRIANLRL
ncbi:MAG: hypothetical protein HYY93_12225 [Planctomycetes bacterium]|nr:hypothetical protein [Planctomycetota bacterium]